VLQDAYDIDFSHYKAGSIMRRIDRWLTGNGQPLSPQKLAERLVSNPGETERLFSDMLIGVTCFFRDGTAFEALRQQGIEPMIDALGERDQLRIWCCACSTGEEAYTLAILALEAFDRRGVPPRVRVLATDLHAASVQKASAGLYIEEALAAMPDHVRHKYFVLQASGLYKVAEHLRRSVVFSAHNVLRDAPFQRIDLVTCRNLLIYLKPPAQAQVLAGFHVALHSGGLLFLGMSEMPSEQAEAFASVDDSAHLYRKRPGLQLPISSRPMFGLPPALRPSSSVTLDNRASYRLQEVLAQRYVPAGFLVNQSDELVYVFGNAGRYLQAAPGRFGSTMFTLLGGALRTAVTMGLRKAAQRMDSTSVSDVVVDEDHPTETLRVEVDPIVDRTLPLTYFMVRLVSQAAVQEQSSHHTLAAPDGDAAQHLMDIEHELQRTREALQRSVEDQGAANEELQAGNEELMAANEELQSSNEELHALNEELYSVNSEHELKIKELRDTSADLNNLIRATELPIVFLDLEARLRLFTPPATEIFPLRPQDIGRELRDFLPRETDASLFEDISRCLIDGRTLDTELVLGDGRFLRRRVAPYRTDLGVTSGLVLTYVDVSQQVRSREQALELSSQSQIQLIIESVPHLMWTCSADGACDFLSPQWESYTGLAAKSQLGYAWLEQIHAEDRDELMAVWNQAVANGRPLRTRFRIRRHDGEYRWFDTRGIPQFDRQGHIVKWYGSNSDVHDVVLLQQSLEERDRFIQMVADNINGMVGYWDRQQRNRFANRHYVEWFGLRAEEFRGTHIREVLGDKVYELNRPYIEAALKGQPQEFERTITRPDGSQGHLLAQYWPHVVDGEVFGFVATVTDVTRVQEARLLADQVFNVSPVAKLIVSDKGRIVRWNPAAQRLLGYPEEALNGLSVDQLVDPALRDRHRMLRTGYMAAPQFRPMGKGLVFKMQRGDGHQVEVEIKLSGVRLEGHQAAVVCIREVAMSAHALKQVRLAEQARNTFLAQMSHEIRTPLNAILGMSQLLELESPTPRQLDRLRRIEEASTHLLAIVNDILDHSAMEAGSLQLDHVPFEVSTLLDRSIAMVADRARIKQLALKVRMADGIPQRLRGDTRRIEQILVNLLTNAVKFTPEGSVTIAVSSSPASGNRAVLRIEVTDTGIGIAAADLDQLFTPFRQLQQGHARRFGGSGLGLSISRQLARAMGGDCGVQSIQGQGSTFWFSIQVERLAEQVTTPTAAPAAATPAELTALCLGKQVLIVEDNEVNLLVISEMLRGVAGLQCACAEDGLKALDLAAEQVFDLVLMDIQMPGIDGLETTRRMRTLPGYTDVPIYALTANVLSDDINACLAAGMNGHIGKPLVIEQLQSVLEELWGPRKG
jgi:two-component system CheB/CheR fusion protein